jgi:hypothetical protein
MIINNQHETLTFSYGAFVWWFGVIEGRMDPMKLGRLQVRVNGYHTDNIKDIPSDKLFWAMPVQGITSAAMNGIGDSPTGIVEGTHVFGFFYDGHNAQIPVILGSIAGIPGEKRTDKGFFDPNGQYPRDEFLNESDVNRLARSEKIEKTVVKHKQDSIDKKVKKALNKGTWDEPKTPYKAEYPFNHVYESESGHIEEFDDTSGSERYHRYHPKGNFIEDHPDGTHVEKIVKDKYEIIHGDDFIHIKGNCNITIDGNANLLVKGNMQAEVNGNKDEYIHGNYQLLVGGTTKIRSGGRLYIDSPRIDLNKPGPRISF